jgi:hypothetical protein
MSAFSLSLQTMKSYFFNWLYDLLPLENFSYPFHRIISSPINFLFNNFFIMLHLP